MKKEHELKAMVKARYARIAEQGKAENASSCCGATTPSNKVYNIMMDDYSETSGYVADADLGLGCGLPTQFANIKKGDTVKVIAGKDKDKEGKVIAVNQKTGKVIVEGVNMLTKHTKPSAQNQEGGIVRQEGPIDISNVMYVHKGTATRVGIKMDGDKKVRYAKSTGEVID